MRSLVPTALPFPRFLPILRRAAPIGASILCLVAQGARAEVRAGFATRDVSTRASVPLGGYGVYVGLPQKTRSSKGVHDPLLASAAAFEGNEGRGVVIVGIDSVGLSSASTRRIKGLVGTRIPQERVPLVLSSSH